ncbi:transcriptional regulator, MarR family [Ruaniaceae bacterium KH17]|nr:transcriptional regulator, MarR family [Ruaniaceae bacterium KH17]
MTSDNNITPISNDPRTLAEERLNHLAMLQTRMQRRGRPGGPGHGPAPDGRGGQGRVLALLAMNPEISQRELTFLLGLSRQALAELLAKLERKGFVERTQSDADRRVVLVKLTDSGRAAAQKIDERMKEPSHLLDDLSDDEVAALADYLARIIDPLEARIAERREQRRQAHDQAGHPHGGHGGGRGHGGPHGHHHGPDGERHYRRGHGRRNCGEPATPTAD